MITLATTPNWAIALPHFTPSLLPTPLLLASLLGSPIFKLGLDFDLNYTPVKFHDCVLQGCDAGVVTKYVHRQTDRQTPGKIFKSSWSPLMAVKNGYYHNRPPAPHVTKSHSDIWIQIHFQGFHRLPVSLSVNSKYHS